MEVHQGYQQAWHIVGQGKATIFSENDKNTRKYIKNK